RERSCVVGAPAVRAHHSLERGRAALRVAECERRNPRPHARPPGRPRGCRAQSRRSCAGEREDEPLDGVQESAGDEKRKQSERKLQKEAEQEARLERRVEGERLGAKQSLGELLRCERERRQYKEQPRRELEGASASVRKQ